MDQSATFAHPTKSLLPSSQQQIEEDMPNMVSLLSLKDESNNGAKVMEVGGAATTNNNNSRKVPLSAALVGAGIVGLGSGIWSMQQAHHQQTPSATMFAPASSSSFDHGLEDLGSSIASIANSSIGTSMSSLSREPRMRGGSGETDVEEILEEDLDRADFGDGFESANTTSTKYISKTHQIPNLITTTASSFSPARSQALYPIDIPTCNNNNNDNSNDNDAFEEQHHHGLPPSFLASNSSSSSTTANFQLAPPAFAHPLVGTGNADALPSGPSLGTWATTTSSSMHQLGATSIPMPMAPPSLVTSKSAGGRYNCHNNKNHLHHYHNNGRNTTTRILLPAWSIGRIIGRGGDVINGIRDLSGSHITIMQSGTDNRSLQYRMVSISGSIASVGLSLQMIGYQAGLFDNDAAGALAGNSNATDQQKHVLGYTGGSNNRSHPHHYQHLHALYGGSGGFNSPDGTEDAHLEDPGIRMVIDASMVGQLLGRKGCRVQEMRVQTGVRRIQVLNADDSRVEGAIRNERIVVILGTSDQCRKAHQLITTTLEMDMLQLQQLELEQHILMQQQKQLLQKQMHHQFQQQLQHHQQHYHHHQQQQQQPEQRSSMPKTMVSLERLPSSLSSFQQPSAAIMQQQQQEQQKDWCCSSKGQEKEEKDRKEDEFADGEFPKEEEVTTKQPFLSVSIAAAMVAASGLVQEDGGCDEEKSCTSSSTSSSLSVSDKAGKAVLPAAPVLSSFPSFHTPSSTLDEDGASDSGCSNSSNANNSCTGFAGADGSQGSSMGARFDEGEFSSELVVRISNDNIGKLIGKEGKIIRRIRLESHCRIDIDDCPPTREYLMRQVRVRGHIQHLQIAAAMIAHHIKM